MPINPRRTNIPRYAPPTAQPAHSWGRPSIPVDPMEPPDPEPTIPAPNAKRRPKRARLDPTENAAIGARLAAAIAAAGLTQGEAARKLGISRVAVTYWCAGASLPNLARFARAVQVLGLDPAIVFPAWFRGR